MKKLMLICAPVTSRSGYGDHARDLVLSFMKHDKYDIKIMDVNWGDTPRNALNVNNPEDKKILDCILRENLNKQPDIYVDIRIPNEFQQHGKFNIGITAGIETTGVSQGKTVSTTLPSISPSMMPDSLDGMSPEQMQEMPNQIAFFRKTSRA